MVALEIDATLEHVQDPQSTVKVQVGSICIYISDSSVSFDQLKSLTPPPTPVPARDLIQNINVIQPSERTSI